MKGWEIYKLKPESVVIHEFARSDVVASPVIETVIGSYMLFCRDDIPVGHFNSVDLIFLSARSGGGNEKIPMA